MSEGSSIVPQLIATFGATLGAFALGNVIAWTSTALPGIQEDPDFGELTDTVKGQIPAIFSLGAALVPWFAALVFPKIGKKWTLLLLSVPFVAGWVLLLFANNVAMVLIGRFITGFSGGAFVMAAPAYISEIAETKYRGALSTVMQLMVTIGILFINLNCSTDWRLLTGICIIPPAALALWMFWMPRSPVFLISKGDIEGAKKSLQFLRGKNAKVDDELEQIKDDFAQSQGIGSVSFKEIVTRKEYLKPMCISLVLMALQQLSGINYVVGYSKEIFESAGGSMDPCVSAMMLGGIQVAGTLLCALVIEKLGRKFFLIISDALICVSMIGVGIFFKMKEDCNDCTGDATVFASKETVESLGWLPLVSLMVFLIAFSVGFGPIPWVMNVEMMAPEARGLTSAICTCFNWLVSYTVMLVIPPLGDAIGTSTCYFIFAAIALAGTIFVVIFVPETKGKSEDEIRQIFAGKKETTDTELRG